MNIKKCFFASLAMALLGGSIFIERTLANHGGPIHDTSSVRTTDSLVDTSVPSSAITGFLDSDTGVFTVRGLGGSSSEIVLSPDVIQAIQNLTGFTGTITGDANTLGSDSSNAITICLSNPCLPSGEGTRAISLNELAELIENDLQNSLQELAAAEASEQRANNQPRKFVRRRASNCISPAIQARKTAEQKLAESQKFVQQIEQLNPENNIW